MLQLIALRMAELTAVRSGEVADNLARQATTKMVEVKEQSNSDPFSRDDEELCNG